MKGKEPSMRDRMDAQAKAKRALLEKARALAPENDPNFAARQAERLAIAEARKKREAEREAAKQAEIERRAQEKAAAEAAKIEAQKAEEEAKEAERLREIAREAERKAARDARYAARKARTRR